MKELPKLFPLIRDWGFVRLPKTLSNWSCTPVQTPSIERHASVSGAATATAVSSQARAIAAAAERIPDRMIAVGTSRVSLTRRRCQPSWRSTRAARSQSSIAATTKRRSWQKRSVRVADMFTISAAPSRTMASSTR